MNTRYKTAARLMVHWGFGIMMGAAASSRSWVVVLVIGSVCMCLGQAWMTVMMLLEAKRYEH